MDRACPTKKDWRINKIRDPTSGWELFKKDHWERLLYEVIFEDDLKEVKELTSLWLNGEVF